jgi:hypothetical protein
MFGKVLWRVGFSQLAMGYARWPSRIAPQRGPVFRSRVDLTGRKLASYAALHEAYADLLRNGVKTQNAADHACRHRSFMQAMSPSPRA